MIEKKVVVSTPQGNKYKENISAYYVNYLKKMYPFDWRVTSVSCDLYQVCIKHKTYIVKSPKDHKGALINSDLIFFKKI